MEEKTLEEKICQVRGEIKDYVKEGEITLTEYGSKIDELLEEQEISKKGDKGYKSLSYTIGSEFTCNGPLEMHQGIKENYITLSGQDVKSEEAKDDVLNYNNVYDRAKKYIAEKTSPENMTRREFIKDVSEYISKQPEMEDVNKMRKEHQSILIPTFIVYEGDFEFKKEEPTYNERISEALGNVREYCKDLKN